MLSYLLNNRNLRNDQLSTCTPAPVYVNKTLQLQTSQLIYSRVYLNSLHRTKSDKRCHSPINRALRYSGEASPTFGHAMQIFLCS